MITLFPALYAYFLADGQRSKDYPQVSTELFATKEEAFNRLSEGSYLWNPADPRGHYKILRLLTEYPVNVHD